jgi:hypothetical protein
MINLTNFESRLMTNPSLMIGVERTVKIENLGNGRGWFYWFKFH